MKATPDDCFHLTIEIVREIHDEAVKNFGGLYGIRDEALLASAVFAVEASRPAVLAAVRGRRSSSGMRRRAAARGSG